MAEPTSFYRHGGPENTRQHFDKYADLRLPDNNNADGIAERIFDFTQTSSIILPASELVVQRFAAQEFIHESPSPYDTRTINLRGYSGSILLGITHSPNPECDLSQEAIDAEFNITLNGKPINEGILKANYARKVIWELLEDESRGGIVRHRDRTRGPRVALQGPTGPADSEGVSHEVDSTIDDGLYKP